MSRLFKENKNLGLSETKKWLSLLQKPSQQPNTQKSHFDISPATNHQENDRDISPDDGNLEPPLQAMTSPPPLQARKTRSGRSYLAQPAITKYPSILKKKKNSQDPIFNMHRRDD